MLKLPGFSARTIAIGYAAISLLVLAMFAGPLWWAWNTNIEQVRTELLQADSRRMCNLFARNGAFALAAAIDSQVMGTNDGVRKIILFTAPNGVKLAGNLPRWPANLPRVDGSSSATIEVDGMPRRIEMVQVTLKDGHRLLVASNLNRFDVLERLFIYGLLGCAIAVLLVAALGGMMIRRALLSRVQNISQTTSAIIEGQLSRRLEEPGDGDELQLLTQTVNRMLDQIEHLVTGVQDVSNAIAHDLRTPLSELRARLEELSVGRPSDEETYAEIDAAINDVDRVMSIFNALLRLAEIDSGSRRGGFVDVDLARLGAEVAEFYLPVAELKDIALSFTPTGNLHTVGDPVLLAQALGNLVENALKYAPENGVIAITARRLADDTLELVVADNGPGVAEDERPKVIERFYRGDASRGTPGVGLGLSVVSAVARLHGGSLALADNLPGLRATLQVAVQRM
ncbi:MULTISPECIES: HAMP domain-containing sensor histidine kinase [unclassified Duganella]|uniref:sensor histidine kinase n=1 Tax=unclassified Duganella TaxID=2636909 RepID=UPI0006FE314C|nr:MULTISPECIES: ATP-binding protein [unclassified Duganella]KQN70576.1 histidine kinase [Duganella sp. Leaf61]MPQ57869.1 HAMP domain-containing protein [Duganella sp. FT27W]